VDPIHVEIMKLMNRQNKSVWQIANESGLSTSTIYNWQKHKTKRPTGVSLHMAAKFLGRKIRLE
jgi:transposase